MVRKSSISSPRLFHFLAARKTPKFGTHKQFYANNRQKNPTRKNSRQQPVKIRNSQPTLVPSSPRIPKMSSRRLSRTFPNLPRGCRKCSNLRLVQIIGTLGATKWLCLQIIRFCPSRTFQNSEIFLEICQIFRTLSHSRTQSQISLHSECSNFLLITIFFRI